MFELFFDHKCRNCGNVMEVGFVTTEYGDKDGVFYPGDYICDKDISHYKSVYPVRCDHCKKVWDDIYVVVRNGQFIGGISKYKKKVTPIESIKNIEEGYTRKILYKESCDRLLGRDYPSISEEELLAKTIGEKVRLFDREFEIHDRYLLTCVRDDSDRIEKIIGGKRYVYKIQNEGIFRYVQFFYHEVKTGMLDNEKIGMIADVYNDIKNVIKRKSGESEYLEVEEDEILLSLDHDEFYKDLINILIPSRDVKEHYNKNNLRFSDREIAAIIYNNVPALGMRTQLLKHMAYVTDDSRLSEEINERLEYDRIAFERFKNNKDGYVYALEKWMTDSPNREPYICGYFEDYFTAYFYILRKFNFEKSMNKGRREEGVADRTAFRIEKYQIISNDNMILKGRAILSPLMEDDIEKRILELDYDGEPVASVSHNIYGDILSYWSSETDPEAANNVEAKGSGRFENAFIYYDLPFEDGDIVKDITDGQTGMIEGASFWREFCKKVSEGKYADYVDTFVLVKTDDEQHKHLCPIYLEKYKKKVSKNGTEEEK